MIAEILDNVMPSDGDNFRTRLMAGWGRVCKLIESRAPAEDIASAAFAAFEKSLRQREWRTPAYVELLRFVQREASRLHSELPGLASPDGFMASVQVGLESIGSHDGAQTTPVLVEAARQTFESLFDPSTSVASHSMGSDEIKDRFERSFLESHFLRHFWDPPSARVCAQRKWSAAQYVREGQKLWSEIEGRCVEAWRTKFHPPLDHSAAALETTPIAS